jgi:hypothetical protein
MLSCGTIVYDYMESIRRSETAISLPLLVTKLTPVGQFASYAGIVKMIIGGELTEGWRGLLLKHEQLGRAYIPG